MNDSLYGFLSALISLLLLNGCIVVSARALRIGSLNILTIEARYVALYALILLIMLNGNQWVAGNLFFPAMAFGLMAFCMIYVRLLSCGERLEAMQDAVALTAVQVTTLLAHFLAFRMYQYWLLEGTNHDSLIYYQGLHWANESRLFVAKDVVRAWWELGACGEGASWIGYDCPLYRGGTYTLAAWAQYFSPRTIGNATYYVAAYAATMVWFACRLLMASLNMQGARFYYEIFLVLIVSFSTGIIGALVNSNHATLLAAASLVLIVSLALRTDLPTRARFVMMGAWCAVAAHVYAESVFYAGLIISFVFLLELPQHFSKLRFGGILRLGGVLLITVFGMGNVVVGQAFSSLLFFGEIAKGGEWFSWYIHQPSVLWLGSFVAGLMMWTSNPLMSVVIVSAIITLFAVIPLLTHHQTRSGVLALIGTSIIAVLYIEVADYQYGEHKIVHLLGPAWTFAVAVAGFKLLTRDRTDILGRYSPLMTRTGGIVILLCLGLVSVRFFIGAVSLIGNYRATHGIDFGLTTLASFVKSGETALVDDTSWVGVEKFHKTHYLTFQLHDEGAKVLLPNITSDHLRGGYFRGSRNDTFSRANEVDWFVQSRGHSISNSVFLPPEATPVWENSDFRLYRLEDNKAVAVAGNGWYDCESTHCWTVSPFEIETYVPHGEHYQLVIDSDLFMPPETGDLTVRRNDGQLLLTLSLSEVDRMRIELPTGWNRLIFAGSWPNTSPLERGISGDGRKLFAAIRRVEVIKTKMESDE